MIRTENPAMGVATEFDTGRQSAVVLDVPGYSIVDFSIVTGFSSTPQYDTPNVKPLNGPPIEMHLPNGHKGKFMVSRLGPGADSFFADIEAGWWSTGAIPVATLYQYITERNGNQTVFRYDGVALSLTDSGSFTQAEAVKQEVSFFASRKTRI